MSSGRFSGLGRYSAKATEATESIQAAEARQTRFELLSIDSISPSPFQARKDFTSLNDLIEDIRKNGVLQPLLVRPLEAGCFELVAGERRLRAAKAAGLRAVPATIRRMDDRDARIFGLTENLRREDLNAYEVAAAAIKLAAELSSLDEATVLADVGHGRVPSAEVGEAMEAALSVMDKRISLQSFRRHYAPLLNLPAPLIEAIQGGASYVSISTLAKATPEQQREWLPHVVSGEWSLRRLQEEMRKVEERERPQQVTEDIGWELQREWVRVSQQMSADRFATLDGRRQRKARRLLGELAALLQERGS